MICKTSALGTNEQIASFKFSSTLNLTAVESYFGKTYNHIKLEVDAMVSIYDNLVDTDSEKGLERIKIRLEFRQLHFKVKFTLWLIIFSGFVSILLLAILFLILFKVSKSSTQSICVLLMIFFEPFRLDFLKEKNANE